MVLTSAAIEAVNKIISMILTSTLIYILKLNRLLLSCILSFVPLHIFCALFPWMTVKLGEAHKLHLAPLTDVRTICHVQSFKFLLSLSLPFSSHCLQNSHLGVC